MAENVEDQTVTVDGVTVTIDPGVTDDYRFMRLIRESQKNAMAG